MLNVTLLFCFLVNKIIKTNKNLKTLEVSFVPSFSWQHFGETVPYYRKPEGKQVLVYWQIKFHYTKNSSPHPHKLLPSFLFYLLCLLHPHHPHLPDHHCHHHHHHRSHCPLPSAGACGRVRVSLRNGVPRLRPHSLQHLFYQFSWHE